MVNEVELFKEIMYTLITIGAATALGLVVILIYDRLLYREKETRE